MALIRPVVLVFQEFASPTVTPATPDLQCLIVGPAYHIRDYFEPGTDNYADKTNMALSAVYGELEADVGSTTPVGDAVITATDAPDNATGALVDEESVVVYFDEARVIIAEGTDATTASATPNRLTVADTVDFTTGADKVLPGDRVIISDGTTSLARTVYAVTSATVLTFTEDLPSSGWTFAGSQAWRIEREVNDTPIGENFYDVNNNTITVDGGVTLSVATQGDKVVTYAKVYVEYRSLRQDLTELDTVASTAEILSKIGRLDARNPLAVGCFVALQNTTAQVQFAAVETDDLVGHTTVRDMINSRPDVYAIVPLTSEPSVITMWNTDCVGLAIADETKGRPQRFRVVIGSGTLPETKTMSAASGTGQSMALAGSDPTTVNKLTIPGATLIANGVVPGDELTIALDTGSPNANGTYTVASVISDTVLTVNGAFPATGSLDAAATYRIRSEDLVTTRRAVGTATSAGTTAANGDLYLILRDTAATFITSGVAVGDLIQMPEDFSNDFTSTLSSFVIAAVLSEQRLQLVNNGPDTSSVQNELPHGVKRAGGSIVPTSATLNYRVARTLTKGAQITELQALSRSFASRRTVLVWPDKVDVAGVTGGANQPGYYASCAVGGMTSGLPPHQGFTNLGIAGISRIYHSNTYFSDSQLTDLSNSGWYVLAQQTPTSLPYTIHQLTTDPSTLETGEFSVVKNFDFVALFFVDILEDFLGVYNVNTETLTLIRAALNIGGDTLKLRTLAKIGAPLTSFSIADLGISPVAGDRVVTHLTIGLPKPLNNIELHLVA